MTHPLASEKPELCAVCRRKAIHLGYRPMEGLPMLWTCGAPDCNILLSRVYGMSVESLSQSEMEAIGAAGKAAGAWLDGVGKTDLAALSKDEWDEFLCRLIDGYQCELRRIIHSDPVPF